MRIDSDLREAAGQFLPLALLTVALATFVAVVPSVRTDGTVVAGRDPFAGAGNPATGPGATGGSGGLAANPAGGGAPGATGASTGGASPGTAGGSGAPTGTGDRPADPGPVGGPAPGPGPGTSPEADCSRREILGPTVSCKPAWPGGDNGGATDRGVTGDEVRFVFYIPRRNEQVDSLLGAAGVRTAEEVRRALPVFEEWFNRNFQLYGRRLKLIFQWGPGQNNDDSQQQADAIRADEENKAFAVFAASATFPFHDELARRGVLSFSGILPMGQQYLQERAPYVLLLIPDNDVLLDHVAEYYCKRLNGSPAAFAGDPVTAAQTRKLGIIHFESTTVNLGADLNQRLRSRCGVEGVAVAYPGDITRAATIAASTIAQLKSEDVTTVTCLCDPIAPVFFTSEATRQAWFPEWLHSGLWGTDSATAGRLYDQTQWAHSFGPSGLGYYTPWAEQSAWKAYWSTVPEGEGDTRAAHALDTEFTQIAVLLEAMERAGPAWTTESVARAIFEGPIRPSTQNPWGGWSARASYGPGPDRPGPFSFVDDMMEIWWDPARTGPDGEPGWLFYVDEGRRRITGQWPDSPPNVFVDDGSRQPGPDPHAQCECTDP